MAEATDIELKMRQAAAARVEERMAFFLLGYEPASNLTVGDLKTIARFARQFAFDEFSPVHPHQ